MGLRVSPGQRWIEGVKADRRVSKVARRALSQRLGSVLYYLPLATGNSVPDVEPVHQLRVATRRSVAALRIFRDLIPRRRAKKVRALLRRVRRAAGDARDLDVLNKRLVSPETKRDRQSKSALDLVVRCRKQAQAPLVRLHKRLRKSRFKRDLKKVVGSVRWKEDCAEPAFGTYARSALQPFVDGFFAKAGADLSTTTALHQLRISGKHLRYAMEIFAGAFDESFRTDLYPVIEEVQDRLGEINDHATARQLCKRWLSDTARGSASKELGELMADEAGQLATSSDQFRKWWSDERSAALRAQFECFLAERTHAVQLPADRQDESAEVTHPRNQPRTAEKNLLAAADHATG